MSDSPRPPVARTEPHRLEKHGHVRTDPYYWLRDRESPEVVSYLEAENAHVDAVLGHLTGFREQLFEEIKGRIKQDDSTVPFHDEGYWYYARFEEGGAYPIHCRKRESLEADEQVMLDVNAVAEGESFCDVKGLAISHGKNLLAWAVDTQGRRIYTIRFRDLSTGEELEDALPAVTGNMAWAADDRTLFYAKQDPQTLRSHRIYRHVLGTDPASDELVYEEKDETFGCYVGRSKSKRYIVISCFQTVTSEHRVLEADDPGGEFRVFSPRRRGHEYFIDHVGDHFHVRTNDGARNFRLARTPVSDTSEPAWEEVIPHREDVLLEDFELFRDHLVLVERRDGLVHLRIRPWSGDAEHDVEFHEPVWLAYPGTNPELDTSVLRFGYSSMTTPTSVFDYDMNTRERTLKKREEVVGGFEPSEYEAQRLHATAEDGTRVPMSVVYRKDSRGDGPMPLLLYGYGSYGASMDAAFSSPRLSLLDRGFAFAIAHVRGGEELGRRWYDEGRLLNKKNTFTDFIACAQHLVDEGYTRPDRQIAMGGSAGGLLMGAVANMRPELFHGMVAAVPFVDVITTMLDESIPLTTGEYDEWGDPNDEKYYRYILSYSPYDNVSEQRYPNLLITTGLHDSQVQYWEPAKWVAKLRVTKTGDEQLLLKTYLEAGHGGPSGRFGRYRELALEYAFMLDLVGRADGEAPGEGAD